MILTCIILLFATKVNFYFVCILGWPPARSISCFFNGEPKSFLELHVQLCKGSAGGASGDRGAGPGVYSTVLYICAVQEPTRGPAFVCRMRLNLLSTSLCYLSLSSRSSPPHQKYQCEQPFDCIINCREDPF